MKKYFFILLVVLLLFSCKKDDGSKAVKAYYFPLKELKEGKVYEYLSIGNPNDPPMYWHYKTMEEEGNQYFVGTSYDHAFDPDQFFREEVVDNGMKLVDFYTYEADSTGSKKQLAASIHAANVFPFKVKKPGNVLLTSLSWFSPEDGARINLVRNRQFDRDTTVNFNGKNIPAIIFNTIELIEHDRQGRLPLEFSGEEIYAKGIGLYGLKKNISPEWQMAYRIADIYRMEEFEEKFRGQ